jgi:3-hydroxyacyl-CoA dehydrogenase
VLVKDAPAFVVNRMLTRFIGRGQRGARRGHPDRGRRPALDPLGLPMSPFELLELVGPAVGLHVSETLHAAFPDRFPSPRTSGRWSAAGKRGLLPVGGRQARWSTPRSRRCSRSATPRRRRSRCYDRALGAIAEEIDLMLTEGVVAEARTSTCA